MTADLLQGEMKEDASNVIAAVGDRKLDMLVNVAGGWAGGNIASDLFESVEKNLGYSQYSTYSLSCGLRIAERASPSSRLG